MQATDMDIEESSSDEVDVPTTWPINTDKENFETLNTSDSDNGSDAGTQDLDESTEVPPNDKNSPSSHQNRMKSNSFDGQEDEESDEDNKITSTETEELLLPVKHFFHERLKVVLKELGGDASLIEGWTTQAVRRPSGLGSNILDIYYYSPAHRKCRNRVDVATAFNLLSSSRAIKHMSRFALYQLAREHREKYLVSQKIILAKQFASIEFRDEQIFLLDENGDEVTSADGVDLANLFFSFGNITVLNWGTLSSCSNFYSSTQLFPIGFRCIRQEHDMVSNRIVDCLCEVLEVPVKSPPEPDPDAEEDEPTSEPLFRITVAWALPFGGKVTRVYEGKTPQIAWQGAMLESLDNVATAVTEHAESDVEVMTDSEMELRSELMELRRSKMRILSAGQSAGLMKALRPRLNIDTIENFFDSSVLRLLEGMERTLDCTDYIFIDQRVHTSGKKHTYKVLSALYAKMRNLDKIMMKQISNENNFRKDVRRYRREHMIKSKKTDLLIEKNQKYMNVVLLQQKRLQLRDFEKRIRCVREELARTIINHKNSISTMLGIDQPKESPSSNDIVHKNLIHGPANDILRIYNYLHSYATSYKFTSLVSYEHFAAVINSCNEHSQQLLLYKNMFKYICAPDPPHAPGGTDILALQEAHDFLSRLSAIMLTILMPLYYKLMSIDTAFAQVPNFIPIISLNPLTHTEILRSIIVYNLAKHCGLNEYEAQSAVKGRGHLTAADMYDKRALRLMRRRMVLRYQSNVSGIMVPVQGPDVCNSAGYEAKFQSMLAHIDYLLPTATVAQLRCVLQLLLLYVNSPYCSAAQYTSTLHELSSALNDATLQLVISHVRTLVRSLQSDAASAYSPPTTSTCATMPIYPTATSVYLASLDELEDILLSGGFDQEDLTEDERNAILTSGLMTLYPVPDTVPVLPVLLSRCLRIVNILISHSLAENFLYPVDKSSVPAYYEMIPYPLCLCDIRACLYRGGYSNATQVYNDVNIMFDNAYAFNPHSSALYFAANKLQMVFERLFLEVVLGNGEEGDFCHACRSCDDHKSKSVLCDRCDAAYHVCCLNPPLAKPPKGEWLCPSCIAERSIEDSHVLLNTVLPTIRYKNETYSNVMIASISKSGSRIEYHVNSASAKLTLTFDDLEAYLPAAPFSYREYHECAQLSQGYVGYGNTVAVPQFLQFGHSTVMQKLRDYYREDSLVDNPIDMSIKVLNILRDPSHSCDEWLLLLQEIIMLNMEGPKQYVAHTSYDYIADRAANITATNATELLKYSIADTIDYQELDEESEKEETRKDNEKLADSENESDSEKSGNNSDSDDGEAEMEFDEESPRESPRADSIQDHKIDHNTASDIPTSEKFSPVEQRISHKRGYEDGLFTQHLVEIVADQVDVVDDEYFHTIQRACLPHVPHCVDAMCWLNGFVESNEKQENLVCSVCHHDLQFMCSRVVHHTTSTEFAALRTLLPAIDQATLTSINSDAIEYNYDEVLGYLYMPRDATSAAMTMLQRIAGTCFICTDKNVDRVEFGKGAGVVVKGSDLAHEFCAVQMDISRLQQIHAQSFYTHKLKAESLFCYANNKIIPFGEDSQRHQYWLIPGSPLLFVSKAKQWWAYDQYTLRDLLRMLTSGGPNTKDTKLAQFIEQMFPSSDSEVLSSEPMVINAPPPPVVQPELVTLTSDRVSDTSVGNSDTELADSDEEFEAELEQPKKKKRRSNSSTPISYQVGDEVLVYDVICNKDGLWRAVVLKAQAPYYYVHFADWPDQFNTFAHEDTMLLYDDTTFSVTNKDLFSSSFEFTTELPQELETLVAATVLNEPNACRAYSKFILPSSTYIRDEVTTIKYAMLMVYAALPEDALDMSEDRWSDFDAVWRNSVLLADNATKLMECQLMLEYGIKTAYLKSNGTKLLTCLCSRIYALQNVNYGLISLRLWTLDQAIDYNKSGGESKKKKKH